MFISLFALQKSHFLKVDGKTAKVIKQ